MAGMNQDLKHLIFTANSVIFNGINMIYGLTRGQEANLRRLYTSS